MHRSHVRCDGVRHVALMRKPDAFGRRAQFQLWIFSYIVLARPSKKRVSRVMFGFRQE